MKYDEYMITIVAILPDYEGQKTLDALHIKPAGTEDDWMWTVNSTKTPENLIPFVSFPNDEDTVGIVERAVTAFKFARRVGHA